MDLIRMMLKRSAWYFFLEVVRYSRHVKSGWYEKHQVL